MKKDLRFLVIIVISLVFVSCTDETVTDNMTEMDLNEQLFHEKNYNPNAEDKTLHWSISGDIQTLDPGYALDFNSITIINNIYEGLVRDINGKIELAVAERIEISQDKKMYTFYIDKYARWSDGSPVTSYDFEFAWKRNLTLGLEKGISTMYEDSNYLNCRAISPTVFRVWLEEPTPYFLKIITEVPFMPMKWDQFAGDDTTQDGGLSQLDYNPIISNGPFTITGYKNGQELILSKNYKYVRALKTKVNTVVVNIVEDPYLAVTAFKSKRVDLNSNVANESVRDILKEEGAVIKYSKPGFCYFAFNSDRSDTLDLNLREAIALVVDRYEIVNSVHQGDDAILDIIPENITTEKGIYYHRFRESRLESIQNDPQKVARALMLIDDRSRDEIGELVYLTPSGEDNIRVAQSIAKSMKKHLDLQVRIVSAPWDEFLELRREGQYDMIREGWICDYNDPYASIRHFKDLLDEEHLELLDLTHQSAAQGRDVNLLAIEKKIYDDKKVIPLYNYVGYYQKNEHVHNLSLTGSGYFYLGDCEVSKEMSE